MRYTQLVKNIPLGIYIGYIRTSVSLYIKEGRKRSIQYMGCYLESVLRLC
jgi:hypothetical protein